MHAPAIDEPSPPRALRIEIAPKTIFLLLGIVAGIWLLGALTTVLTVVTVALVLVGTFDPVVAWLERRNFRRGRALVLVFVVAVLMLAAIVLLMVPPLFQQLVQLVESAPKAREHLVASLSGYSWSKPLIMAIKDLPLDDMSLQAGKMAVGYSARLLEMVGYGISTLFLAIYLLADPVRSKGLLYAVVPRRLHVKLAKVLLELKLIVGGYMRGQLITSLAIGVFVFVLLTAFGAQNALPIALFAALTDIIPFVGGYVASTPVVIAVSPHGTTVTLIVLGVMMLYQEFESRILVPRVYGRVLRLPPSVVLVALLVGGTLAGILGALLALPIAAGVRMLIRELRVDLPGEESAGAQAQKEMDDRAAVAYEHMSEGANAADAGAIAEDLAHVVMGLEADEAVRFNAEARADAKEARAEAKADAKEARADAKEAKADAKEARAEANEADSDAKEARAEANEAKADAKAEAKADAKEARAEAKEARADAKEARAEEARTDAEAEGAITRRFPAVTAA